MCSFFSFKGAASHPANNPPFPPHVDLRRQSLVIRKDASFPLLDELHGLLQKLRTDALRARTQERVLLAAVASRCGNMSEAFSNSYVSAIVRAGEALGHENMCEFVQNEECQASTMAPYDYFHDNAGVWEEPCRPAAGYHASVSGGELMRQAHARSVIQQSLRNLQGRLRLKGGVADGGSYSRALAASSGAGGGASGGPPTPTSIPPITKTHSGSLKKKSSSFDFGGGGGASGGAESVFNPDHVIEPMAWDPHDVAHCPYGLHDLDAKVEALAEDDNNGGPSLARRTRSSHEIEWEEVANMFFHGGSTRSIDTDFAAGGLLGKKQIFAPEIRPFDPSSLDGLDDDGDESDEDISDETMLRRHEKVLAEMKIKIDAALARRSGSGRKRADSHK